MCTVCYLAVSEDSEEQRQALVHKLGRVIIRPDLQEVLQQLINDGLEAVFVGGGQRVHPAMERPRHAQISQVQRHFCKEKIGTMPFNISHFFEKSQQEYL